jgi:uncharacterized membrane protein YuzA (DUF378 family)
MWFIDFPTLILVIAGGLNLGVLGFFGFDVAGAIFGPSVRIVYAIIGLSAGWQLWRQKFF